MSVHSESSANRLKQVMALDGPEFLGQAYLLMLGRPVDPEGFRNYDTQLRSGISKISILTELRSSPEGRAHGANGVNVPDPLALLAQAPRAISSPTTSLHNLLRMNGSTFVDQCFISVIGRLPDDDVRRHYLTSLNAGADKLQILSEILETHGGGQATPMSLGLKVAVRNMCGGLYPIAANIGELLALDDIDFIDCAYKTLLRRAPDAVGAAHYLQLVRSGLAKIGIVSRLCFSAEGRKRLPSLSGLKRALLRYWLATNWLTGWLYRPIAQAEGETPLERRLRVIENTLMRMADERAGESGDLDAAVDDVARLLKALADRRSA